MAWLLSFCFDRHRQLKLTAGGALSYFHSDRNGATHFLLLRSGEGVASYSGGTFLRLIAQAKLTNLLDLSRSRAALTCKPNKNGAKKNPPRRQTSTKLRITPNQTTTPPHSPRPSTPHSSPPKSPRHPPPATASRSASPAPSPPAHKRDAPAAARAAPCHPCPAPSHTANCPAGSSPTRPRHPAKRPAATAPSSP